MQYKILELMEGARNCVNELVKVQPGERVLILDDLSGFADTLVVQSLGIACKDAGADVTFVTGREFEPRIEDPPKIIENAMHGADVILHVSSHEATLHCRAARIAMLEYGTRIIAVVANNPELMCSEWARFPVDLYFAITRKVHEQVQRGKKIRVIGDNGTDISASIKPAHVMGFSTDDDGIPSPPTHGSGMFTMFPLGVYGVHPFDPAEGVIVYDVLLGLEGLLETKIKVTVKDHYIHSIEGGWEAKWFQKLIDSKKNIGIESDYWSEIMWGVNPKASIKRGLKLIHLRESELTRRAGTIHFGVGKGARGFHWDGVLVTPFSVFVDDDIPIIVNGRLQALDDPEIVELASHYGDPSQLLTETP